MSPRKQEIAKLKGNIAKIKHLIRTLPRLIDCSEVYGDGTFTKDDYKFYEDKLKIAEQELEDFKAQNPPPPGTEPFMSAEQFFQKKIGERKLDPTSYMFNNEAVIGIIKQYAKYRVTQYKNLLKSKEQ